MPKPEYRDRLHEVEDELNRRGATGRTRERRSLLPFTNKPRTSWEDPGESGGEGKSSAAVNHMGKRTSAISFATILLIISVVFFATASVVAYFKFATGGNTVSSENIDITISGPLSVSGGTELSMSLMIQNKNPLPLESARLLIEFPDGTRMPGAISQELTRTRETLGTIEANSFARSSAKAVLFGEEGSEVIVRTTLEYRVQGSNAIYVKTKDYSVTLASSPVNVRVSAPESITTNQEVVLVVEVQSNNTETMRDILVHAVYPPGFQFKEASLQAVSGNSMWKIDSLDAGDIETLTVRGLLVGDDNETKVFRFTTGIGVSAEKDNITVPYATQMKTLTINRPQLGLTMLLAGDTSPSIVAQEGKAIRGDLAWVNNLPERILHARITITIEGDALNARTVSAGNGFYQSGTNSIVITEQDIPQLAVLEPGSKGQTTFGFEALSQREGSGRLLRNPEIVVRANITGDRIMESATTPTLVTEIQKSVRITSAVQVASLATYSSGPFANTGPLPPKVGEETTYTIVWAVTNVANDLRDVEVRASLPASMRWLGQVSPTGEDLTHSGLGGEIVWRIPALPSGVGFASPVRQVAFQIGLTPSISQSGKIPDILSDVDMTAKDNYTHTTVTSKAPHLTTSLTSDPAFKESEARVVE